MILVLGSGFGLYGHLAALTHEARPVATLARYRAAAQARPELSHLLPRIEWVDAEEEALARARMSCLVRRPADNAALAGRLARTGEGGALVIEKPVAPDWRAAQALERQLEDAARPWAVPYLFLHTDWIERLRERLAQDRPVAIHWSHRQSPLVRGWKQSQAEGGDIPFYFIHCLAVLEAAIPGARLQRLAGPGVPSVAAAAGSASLTVEMVLADRMGFEVRSGDEVLYAATTPFGAVPAAGSPDPRIEPLRRFYRSIGPDGLSGRSAAFHTAVTRHWRDWAGDGDDAPADRPASRQRPG